MPRIIPALCAVAVIAFSIGFNIVRYPTVWEMVGPTTNLPEASAGTDMVANSQPVQATETIASIPNGNLAASPVVEQNMQMQTTGNIPQSEMDSAGNHEMLIQPESAIAANVNRAEPLPLTAGLTPIPSNLFIGNKTQSSAQYPTIKRLPPVAQVEVASAGRYTAEYAHAPIPIYPSTGK